MEKIVEQVGSVAFSGIGTTIAFQSDFLPTLIKNYSPCSNELFLFFLDFFVAILVFAVSTSILWFLIHIHNADTDEKKHDKDRKELAEYFHKVILNNILTAISFMKRAWNKKKSMIKRKC